MIPLNPASSYIRTQKFVQEEWDTYFANNISTIQGGWRGILMANYAMLDQTASYDFFAGNAISSRTLSGSSESEEKRNVVLEDADVEKRHALLRRDFDLSFLDGGASRTWYMAWAAGLAGIAGHPF
jgi:endo-1,3(4)-beta-glucanase